MAIADMTEQKMHPFRRYTTPADLPNGKFDNFDGRPRIPDNDPLKAKLYEIHRNPRFDLVDLGLADRPVKSWSRF